MKTTIIAIFVSLLLIGCNEKPQMCYTENEMNAFVATGEASKCDATKTICGVEYPYIQFSDGEEVYSFYPELDGYGNIRYHLAKK